MDVNWRDEYEAAVIERNGLIMALMAAEKRESAAIARAEAAERRVAELEAPATWRHPIADNPAKELQDTAMCELIVIGEWDTEDDTWSVEDLVWFSRYSPSVTHWRPLPLWRRGE